MNTSQRSGAVLLGAAVVVALLGGLVLDAGYGNLAGFYLMPLLAGLGFLVAAAAGGRGPVLWATGLTVTVWGVLIQLHFRGILLPRGDNLTGTRDVVIYAASVVVAGVVALAVMRWQRLVGGPLAVVAVVLVSLALYGLALAGVPGIVSWWLYPLIMAARAGWELLPRMGTGTPGRAVLRRRAR